MRVRSRAAKPKKFQAYTWRGARDLVRARGKEYKIYATKDPMNTLRKIAHAVKG